MLMEQYVDFETAKLLKEKGFSNNWCNRWYNTDIRDPYPSSVGAIGCFPCPTQQMACRWLREKCKILLWVYPIIPLPVPKKKNEFYWMWKGKKQRHSASFFRNGEKKYKSYEEACEEAIKFCLENLEEIDYE